MKDIENPFIQWFQGLALLAELEIPRKMFGDLKRGSLTFHVLVDASQVAYGAAIFARTQTQKSVEVMLVKAMSRVAPNEVVTIPRLELLAATMRARLMDFIAKSLQIEQIEKYYWSDSTTELSWIQQENQWATFVWNRIQEIRQLTDSRQWRHVRGEMNPANLPSRGCTIKQLLESKWWERRA